MEQTKGVKEWNKGIIRAETQSMNMKYKWDGSENVGAGGLSGSGLRREVDYVGMMWNQNVKII